MSVNPNNAWANNSTPLFTVVGTPASAATTSASNVLYQDLNGLTAISVAALAANSFSNVLTIPSTYFPTATTTYRLTTSWRFDSAVFNPTPTTGCVGVQGGYGGSSTTEVDNASNGSMRGTFSTVFRGGNNFGFLFYNGTLATITSGTLTFTSMTVSGVTTSNNAFGTF